MKRAADRSLLVTSIGGATLVLQVGGWTLLTDPALSPRRTHQIAPGLSLTRTTDPAAEAFDVETVDAVLLSHDQHPDNLDDAGRELVARRPTFSTKDAAERLGASTTGMDPWDTVTLSGDTRSGHDDGGPARAQDVQITAVPAAHATTLPEAVVGPVIGFVVETAGCVVYLSGDNVDEGVAGQVAERWPQVDLAVLHLGAARLPIASEYLTMTADAGADVAETLGEAIIVASHGEGWSHLTQSLEQTQDVFRRRGSARRLFCLRPGERAGFTALEDRALHKLGELAEARGDA